MIGSVKGCVGGVYCVYCQASIYGRWLVDGDDLVCDPILGTHASLKASRTHMTQLYDNYEPVLHN